MGFDTNEEVGEAETLQIPLLAGRRCWRLSSGQVM